MSLKTKRKWATSRKQPVFGVCDQVRLKPVCSATETSQSLEILDLASIGIILSRQRTRKALIRLRGIAGWSARLCCSHMTQSRFWHDVAINEPEHDKTYNIKWAPGEDISVCPSAHSDQFSMSAGRSFMPLVSHRRPSGDYSDQAVRVCRLIRVSAGHVHVHVIL